MHFAPWGTPLRHAGSLRQPSASPDGPYKQWKGKELGATIGGVGLGLPIGEANDRSGDGMAIGFPIGAGVGLATGWLTPGVNFKAGKDEDVLVELKVDCSLYNDYTQQYTTTTRTIIEEE